MADSNNMDVDDNDNASNKEEESTKPETNEELEQRALKFKADGNKKYSDKDYRGAIGLYSSAIITYPRPEFYGNRAAAYIAISDYSSALSDCLSALDIDSNFRKAFIRGIKCYTALGELTEAQKFGQKGLDKFKNDKQIKEGLNRVNIIQNKINRINKKLDDVSIKYQSMFEQTNNNNKNDKKDENKEEETELKEQQKVIHKLTSHDLKEVSLAQSMISNLLNNELSQSLSLKCLDIKSLIIAQNNDQALSKSTTLLRWNKNNVDITKLRAISLFRIGNTDSAIKHLQNILRKDPDNKECKILFKLFKSIGRCKEAGNKAFKSSDLDLAIVKYSECLVLDRPNLKFNSVIYANRAAVWLKKKNYSNAYDDCTESINLDNSYIKPYNRRVQALYGLERYQEAVVDAENALKLDPSSNELKSQLRSTKIELKKSKRKNYYKILGIQKDATEKEIKKGFRKKAMEWHPDRHTTNDKDKDEAEVKFKEIGEAYEVLKDPKMKQRYDSGQDLEEIKQGGMGGHFGMGGGVDISHIFDMLGNMQGGRGGHQHHGHGGGGQNFSFRFG